MAKKAKSKFDPKVFLTTVDGGRAASHYRKDDVIFSQGDPADAVFYIRKGKVKLVVKSEQGREAVVAILGAEAFFGEGCLIGQPLRLAKAAALIETDVTRVEKVEMIRVLHAEPAFGEVFTAHLLTRNSRVEEDLVDQLFNSSEKRLARTLLLLANYGKDSEPDPVTTRISQETLAEIIGTTRSRVNQFMNKFRKLGFIEYNGGLHVHNSLLSVLLHRLGPWAQLCWPRNFLTRRTGTKSRSTDSLSRWSQCLIGSCASAMSKVWSRWRRREHCRSAQGFSPGREKEDHRRIDKDLTKHPVDQIERHLAA